MQILSSRNMKTQRIQNPKNNKSENRKSRKCENLRIWKLEKTSVEWKKTNLKMIKERLSGWQLKSFNESYEYKIKNGISLFKRNLKNE